MSRIIIISFFLLTNCSICFAQDTAQQKFNVLKGQIKTRLTFLEKYNYWTNQDFDIDKYSEKTSVLLTDLLKQRPPDSNSLKDIKNLSLSAKTNDSLQVHLFNFGYNSGGSRGWITHPIIQWRDGNGIYHAYNLSTNINCRFYQIHKLTTTAGNLYLLIGSEKGNSSTIQNIAYVIKIDEKNIFSNYKAFINRSYINLPNSKLSFNDKTQTLKCISDTDNENFTLHLEYIEPTKDTLATRKLLQMFFREYNEPICLKFIGGRFVRQTKCR
jgi:hypothetical protein